MSLDINSLSSMKSEGRAAFVAEQIANQQDAKVAQALWECKASKASFIINTATDEIVRGDRITLSQDEIIEIEDSFAAKKEPYGNVPYADSGYQQDKKKRYPIDTEEHIRAAWSYINQDKNQKAYSLAQVSKIKVRIVAAWKRVIDKSGPPSA